MPAPSDSAAFRKITANGPEEEVDATLEIEVITPDGRRARVLCLPLD